jgi:hypothetical protein
VSAKRPWRAPVVLSRPIAVVEQLLAETYGAQAKAWAATAKPR